MLSCDYSPILQIPRMSGKCAAVVELGFGVPFNNEARVHGVTCARRSLPCSVRTRGFSKTNMVRLFRLTVEWKPGFFQSAPHRSCISRSNSKTTILGVPNSAYGSQQIQPHTAVLKPQYQNLNLSLNFVQLRIATTHLVAHPPRILPHTTNCGGQNSRSNVSQQTHRWTDCKLQPCFWAAGLQTEPSAQVKTLYMATRQALRVRYSSLRED